MEKTKRILPPVYFLASVCLMAALHFLFPIVQILPDGYTRGAVFILIGMSLILWAVWLFIKAGTAIKPFEESSRLVVAGPYRWSRNPIYLGMAFILLGIGLALGTLTPFVIVPLFVWLIQRNFITHEEAILDESFGAAYAEYKKRIRRWL